MQAKLYQTSQLTHHDVETAARLFPELVETVQAVPEPVEKETNVCEHTGAYRPGYTVEKDNRHIVYTVKQCAKILGATDRTVYNLVKHGHLSYYRSADHVKWSRRFISESQLRRYAEKPESRCLHPNIDFGRV